MSELSEIFKKIKSFNSAVGELGMGPKVPEVPAPFSPYLSPADWLKVQAEASYPKGLWASPIGGMFPPPGNLPPYVTFDPSPPPPPSRAEMRSRLAEQLDKNLALPPAVNKAIQDQLAEQLAQRLRIQKSLDMGIPVPSHVIEKIQEQIALAVDPPSVTLDVAAFRALGLKLLEPLTQEEEPEGLSVKAIGWKLCCKIALNSPLFKVEYDYDASMRCYNFRFRAFDGKSRAEVQIAMSVDLKWLRDISVDGPLGMNNIASHMAQAALDAGAKYEQDHDVKLEVLPR